MLETFKRMWVAWGNVAKGILTAQNWIIMGTAYVVAIGPMSLWFRLTGRRLIDHAPADPTAKSYWQPRTGKPMTMDEAARQF